MLLQGLKSQCEDYFAASLKILAQLVSHVSLKDEMLEKLMVAMTRVSEQLNIDRHNFLPVLPVSSMSFKLLKRMTQRFPQEIIACLALIFHTQEIRVLPKK